MGSKIGKEKFLQIFLPSIFLPYFLRVIVVAGPPPVIQPPAHGHVAN